MLPFPATIDHSVASSITWQANARAANYQLDLTKTDTFDSSLLALLLDLRRTAAAEGKTVTIHNAPAKLTQLATLYGVAELIA